MVIHIKVSTICTPLMGVEEGSFCIGKFGKDGIREGGGRFH